MKNFLRTVRLALRRRLTFCGMVVGALGVALLWGANIGAVYPFVQVMFQGDSLQQWAVKKIDQADRTIAEKATELATLRQTLAKAPEDEQPAILVDLKLLENRLKAERKAADHYRNVLPYIEKYVPHDRFITMLYIVAFILIGTIIKDGFLVINGILVARLAQSAAFDLRTQFYRRTLHMELAAFDKDGTADLMSRMTNDLNGLVDGLLVLFGKMVREPLKMIACLAGAAMISWRLLVLSLLVAPLAGFAIGWLAKALKRTNRRAMEEMAQIYARLEETFRAIKIVKAFTSESYERRRFHQQSRTYFRKAMRIARYDSLSKPITEITGIVTICLALLAGAWLVFSNETHLLGIKMSERPLDFGALALFYAFLFGAADPMRKLSDIFARLQRASAAADRVYQRLDRKPAIRTPRMPEEITSQAPALTFDNVSFAYQENALVLRNVDLEIPHGKTVVFVGPNGCGKSTLLSLIPRFYDPTDGEVRLGGTPLRRLRLRDVRERISLVSQETHLFDDTVFNNIKYGSPGATREDVIRAAQRAHAHEMIERDLVGGYEKVVGPNGERLSGGQRQRVALARAILRDPAILLLDEATSQIDGESEKAIHAALEQYVKGRTVIIITHRLSILTLADQVVVMEDGRISDTGTHEELMTRCAWYRRQNLIAFGEVKKAHPAPSKESVDPGTAAA